ncbi:hypothetical protein JZO66_02235 [Enterococcus sp. DIV0242_7C1]|uniref:Uncharacterized protein n=1 Tax=Candidatus Enterococcus dunnyi TaxID=1834192 RepID=A0A200JDS0_9ENTE|nr:MULTISPECIES: hypothetical protein [unclassified Enterococcus]MBO0469349.1 hypothetical protein [Enterococcus sp. DIV0242_7C1]MCA5012932.1 hypothetical protein [Enterococcus sp. S23]MCA5016183.1 hypothetical protein [Enterococcus sp. S22(2020)]OUZ35356.1 hypothetical protein A5889_000832 [Enterococcus sp. 9D6_DIV0238]
MKKNFIDAKDDVIDYLNKQKKMTAIIIGIAVLFIISLFFMIPKVQANIRASQIQSIVSQTKLAKKANYLDAKTADQQISEKTAMTVLFSVPSGKTYDAVIDVLKDTDQMKTFNHSIYIYPIVYNAEKIEEKYKLKKDETTVIFFESGKEKNRFTLETSQDIKTTLIPALNQLPLSSVEPTVQTPAENTTHSTAETTQTTQETQTQEVDEQGQVQEQPTEAEVPAE